MLLFKSQNLSGKILDLTPGENLLEMLLRQFITIEVNLQIKNLQNLAQNIVGMKFLLKLLRI